jgi:ADP-ribose pyrophosphatase YjhB (NUDIX family)
MSSLEIFFDFGENKEKKFITRTGGLMASEEFRVLYVGTPLIVVNNNGVLTMPLIKKGIASFWKLLGGELENGENFRKAAIREAREEAGFIIELWHYPGCRSQDRPVPDLIVNMRTYLARLTGGALRLEDGVRDFNWFDLQNLPPKYDLGPNIPEALAYFALPHQFRVL